MKNKEKNLRLTKKVANIFMKIGDIHAKEFSGAFAYYEPNISMNLLKDSNKTNK